MGCFLHCGVCMRLGSLGLGLPVCIYHKGPRGSLYALRRRCHSLVHVGVSVCVCVCTRRLCVCLSVCPGGVRLVTDLSPQGSHYLPPANHFDLILSILHTLAPSCQLTAKHVPTLEH